nr:MAG TPA: hypothetical protein [Caudoviricetes sp.]
MTYPLWASGWVFLCLIIIGYNLGVYRRNV